MRSPPHRTGNPQDPLTEPRGRRTPKIAAGHTVRTPACPPATLAWPRGVPRRTGPERALSRPGRATKGIRLATVCEMRRGFAPCRPRGVSSHTQAPLCLPGMEAHSVSSPVGPSYPEKENKDATARHIPVLDPCVPRDPQTRDSKRNELPPFVAVAPAGVPSPFRISNRCANTVIGQLNASTPFFIRKRRPHA